MKMNDDRFGEFNDAFKKMKNILRNIWNDVEDFLHEVEEVRANINTIYELRKSWHVPKNTVKHHQVMDRKPMFSHIRNRI